MVKPPKNRVTPSYAARQKVIIRYPLLQKDTMFLKHQWGFFCARVRPSLVHDVPCGTTRLHPQGMVVPQGLFFSFGTVAYLT